MSVSAQDQSLLPLNLSHLPSVQGVHTLSNKDTPQIKTPLLYGHLLSQLILKKGYLANNKLALVK